MRLEISSSKHSQQKQIPRFARNDNLLILNLISLAPACWGADPAVFAEFGVDGGGEGALGAGGDVGFDVARFAHAGDDRAYVFVVEDEAQSHFRHGHAVLKKRLEGVGVGHAGLEIFGDEIGAAPIGLGPGALECERSGE